MHNDAASPREATRPPSNLSLNRGGPNSKPQASPQRPSALPEHTTAASGGPPATSASSVPQFKLKSTPSSSTISFTRVASTPSAQANTTTTKTSNWADDMQTQEISSQGALASQFDLGGSQPLFTQGRDASSTITQPPRIVLDPSSRKIDPLDEESDSSDSSSDEDDDSDSSSGSEGIEVISAEDSSDDEEDSRRAQNSERLKAQTALLTASAVPTATSKPATPEKGGMVTSSASHSPIKDEQQTASGTSTPAKESAPTGPGMDLCCIDGCTKVHSNHVYNEAVGRMRELPNSQRMCRAHYIQGLGQCCVKDCTNKATNRNLKKGAKLPIKEGLHDQLHKVCMEHWNLVDQQTKSNESKKKGKRKKKDTKSKGKKRRRNSGDAEVEAFLASELGGKVSGESDSGYSDDESEAEATDARRNGANEFYAVQKSSVEARGEKRDRVASTLSEEDASSDSDREGVKRRRTLKEDNGRPAKVVVKAKPAPTTPGRTIVHGHADRTEASLGEPKAKETKGATSEVQLLRGEVAQLRNELREVKQFMKNALAQQLEVLRNSCTGLIDAKLSEAHEREMAQLRIIHQAAANRQPRPPSAAAAAARERSA